jgi:inner membrane protein
MESELTPTPSTFSSLFDKGKLFLKSVFIFVMALVLWIPTSFINDVITERQGRQYEAIADISNKWAGSQVVAGPLLMIPYFKETTTEKGEVLRIRHEAYFMPDKLDAKSDIVPEKRHRGIYQVVVYRSNISMTGKFNSLHWQDLKVAPDKIMWSEARLLFSVSDNLRGINEDVSVNWNDSTVIFNPEPSGESGIKDALVAQVPLSSAQADKEQKFSLHFSLNGSQKLLFTASGRENKVEMNSSWKDPSFIGIKLPDERKVSDSGFTATWKYMNRSVPLVWNDKIYNLDESSVGSSLIIPVDGYDKTQRSVKYALLCIILTFASFFLIESIYKKPLHLIQYGLAGLALVLFYTLLLSISEYLGFNMAYLIAGSATIGLVTWYIGSIMHSSKLATFISFVLAVVYGYIFTIIQLQDYSLLMGSIGLFIALAVIMFFSRKLKW